MLNTKKTIQIKGCEHIAYKQDFVYTEEEMLNRSTAYYEWLDKRRSIRTFSNKPVSKIVIENLILSASTAPSGAHKQPWTFCAVSNTELKAKIRAEAEAEEKKSYETRMNRRWKNDLKPLATGMQKPFLEIAPWLIIAFKKTYDLDEKGKKYTNYYVNESIGIACGMLITAIHNAGLVTLTYTPSPMNFLTILLKRPSNERAYLLFPVGYADEKIFVPNIARKRLDEVSSFYE